MEKHLSPDDRRRLAEMAGVDPATLYQAITGRGYGFKPEKCVEIEAATSRELRRWDLRPKDWHRIWPELIGVKGAPRVIPDVVVTPDYVGSDRRTVKQPT